MAKRITEENACLAELQKQRGDRQTTPFNPLSMVPVNIDPNAPEHH